MSTSTGKNIDIPKWAGKPPPGLHLDVVKEGKMIQKLMIDEKKCYFFGRNRQMCDFTVDHASCSRVHAILVWHKHLNRPFIIDLGSMHGSYIGTIRLEGHKPQQVPIDSELHFGASTRKYIIRERPQQTMLQSVSDKTDEDLPEGGFLGLPETETELDNLTEFNTAHNRRIASIVDSSMEQAQPLKRKRPMHVNFNEEEMVINPEDIDPSVGRFRNMVSTTVIPNKRMRLLGNVDSSSSSTDHITKRMQHIYPGASLYDHMAPDSHFGQSASSYGGVGAKLGLKLPNLAPEVDIMPPSLVRIPTAAPPVVVGNVEEESVPAGPKKKKYAKEAWPGKKPTPSLLV